MALPDARLRLAVRMTERALRAAPEAPLAARLDAFRRAYAAVRALDAGAEAWTEDTLDAAWRLVEDVWPAGGPVAEVARDLTTAHAVVRAVADPPAARPPSRPRRDG